MIAVILKGISYLEKYDRDANLSKKINYKSSLDNYNKYIFNDLKNNGYTVDVFLYTYNSEMNNELLQDYNPVCYKFVDFDNSLNRHRAQAFNNVNSIKMFYDYVNKNNILYDYVIFTRFDLTFTLEITKFNFDKSLLNIGNTGDVDNNGICCDLIISSQKLLDVYSQCSLQVYNKNIKHLHAVYKYLITLISDKDINFMFKRYVKRSIPYIINLEKI